MSELVATQMQCEGLGWLDMHTLPSFNTVCACCIDLLTSHSRLLQRPRLDPAAYSIRS